MKDYYKKGEKRRIRGSEWPEVFSRMVKDRGSKTIANNFGASTKQKYCDNKSLYA